MRTKTPKQIHEQWERLSDALLLASWNGHEYANARYNAMFEHVTEKAKEYIHNIYALSGCDQRTASAARANYIWATAATPVSTYAKNV